MSSPASHSIRTRNRIRSSTAQSVDILNSVSNSSSTTNRALVRPRTRKLYNRKPFIPRSNDIFDVPPSSPEPARRIEARHATETASDTQPLITGQRGLRRHRFMLDSEDENQQKSHFSKCLVSSDINDSDPEVGSQGSGGFRSSGEGETFLISRLPGQSLVTGDDAPGMEPDTNLDATEIVHVNPNSEELEACRTRHVDSEDKLYRQYSQQEEAGGNMDERAENRALDSSSPIRQSDTLLPAATTRKRKLSATLIELDGSLEAESGKDRASDTSSLRPRRRLPENEMGLPEPDSHELRRSQPHITSHHQLVAYVEITDQRRRDTTHAPNNQCDNSQQIHKTSSTGELPYDSPRPESSRASSIIAESTIGDEIIEHEDATKENGANENSRERGDSERTLFAEARALGGQKESWKTFFRQAKGLRGRADIATSKTFDAPVKLILELESSYKEVRVKLSKGNGISPKSIKGCENLLRGISTEAVQILDTIWRLSTRGKKDRAQDLLYGFETQVIPPMASLTGYCFLAYYVGKNQFPKRHLHRLMALLCSLCDRIYHQAKSGVVKTKVLSKKLRTALQRLISALDSGSLNLQHPVPSRIDKHAQPFSLLGDLDPRAEFFPEVEAPLTRREWTDDEGKALIEGLKQCQGPDRYIEIIRHYGARLPDRTIYELRLKAQEVRDNFLPMAEDLLSSNEGRRKMQWLLDV